MASDYLPNDLNILWKELSTRPLQLSPDQLRKEMEKLNKGLRRRSVLGGGAALIVMAGFTFFIFALPGRLQRIGSILTVLGAGYSLFQLKMHARARPNVAETDCTEFYRAELKHQRDFHRGTWLWSRMPMIVPGPLLFLVGRARADPEIATVNWLELAAFLILAVIAVPLNLRLARKYQRRLDALNASLESTGKTDKKD